MQAKDSGRPYFIVLEGLDGSGKSTHIGLLKQGLKKAGRRVAVTAEPTSTAIGGLIRDSLPDSHRRAPAELAGLFLADRIAHNVNPVWGIDKLLADGYDVICDRYYYSTFVYQGPDTNLDWVMDMNLNCPAIRRPDLCIFLDVDPAQCKSRVDSRPHQEIFENEEFLRRTRMQFFDIFERLKERDAIRIVNADRPVVEVARDVYTAAAGLIRPQQGSR